MDQAEVMRALESIVESYEKVTHSITLGLDVHFRRYAISRVVGKRILDVGSGSGAMVKELKRIESNSYVVMLEPIMGFARILRRRFPLDDVVRGFAEYAPFRDKVFETVMCGFMLRDVISISKALINFERLSRNRIVILDFWRPNSNLVFFFELLYMNTVLALAALAASPRDFRNYLVIPKTVLRVPKLRELKKRLKECELKKWFLGIVFVAVKYH